MKRISLILLFGILFIPSVTYAATPEGELRTCLDGEDALCTVTSDVALTEDLLISSDKTVQLSNEADIYLNGFGLKVNGHLFVGEGSNYILDKANSNITFGNNENSFYGAGTPDNCVGVFATTTTDELCDDVPEVILSVSSFDDNYATFTLNSDDTLLLDVKGEMVFNRDTTIPQNSIINVEDEDEDYIVFKGTTINNGIINSNILILGDFTNNRENGLTKHVDVSEGATFTNNEDITLTGLLVSGSGTNTFTNKSNVTITSNYGYGLVGTVNNTGTITVSQEDSNANFGFGYNTKNYTGDYPEITYIKNLDYGKRVFVNDTFYEDGNSDYEYEAKNGLLFYCDVLDNLDYYRNIMSSDKNEFNVVASVSNDNGLYLELLFNESQSRVNVEYENIEAINMLYDDNYSSNSVMIDNNNSSDYNNDDNDEYYSNYYSLDFIDKNKPIYFKYKIKGFTTGEEVLVQGAITPNGELSALFEGNGGSYTYPVFETAEHLITAPTNPTKTGYTFEGWYTEKELTNKFDFNTAIDENITLYASWEKLPENPKTYDNIGVYLLISMISLLGLGCTTFIKIRF